MPSPDCLMQLYTGQIHTHTHTHSLTQKHTAYTLLWIFLVLCFLFRLRALLSAVLPVT